MVTEKRKRRKLSENVICLQYLTYFLMCIDHTAHLLLIGVYKSSDLFEKIEVIIPSPSFFKQSLM